MCWLLLLLCMKKNSYEMTESLWKSNIDIKKIKIKSKISRTLANLGHLKQFLNSFWRIFCGISAVNWRTLVFKYSRVKGLSAQPLNLLFQRCQIAWTRWRWRRREIKRPLLNCLSILEMWQLWLFAYTPSKKCISSLKKISLEKSLSSGSLLKRPINVCIAFWMVSWL